MEEKETINNGNIIYILLQEYQYGYSAPEEKLRHKTYEQQPVKP